jgi:hypothetical protein
MAIGFPVSATTGIIYVAHPYHAIKMRICQMESGFYNFHPLCACAQQHNLLHSTEKISSKKTFDPADDAMSTYLQIKNNKHQLLLKYYCTSDVQIKIVFVSILCIVETNDSAAKLAHKGK